MVDIVLSDDKGGSTSYQITLDVQEAPNRNPEHPDLPTSLTIQKTNTPTPWSYALPATSDLDTQDIVSETVNIPAAASAFLTFDTASRELRIDNLEDELNDIIPIGSYQVDIALDDGNGGSASYQITLTVLEAPNRDPEFATDLQTYHTI